MGDKQLQHWIEDWDVNRETAVVWVEVPSIPANSNTKITMYYGNPSASDISSGRATFELFDDFETSGLFSNWETFTTGGSETEVSSGIVNLITPKFHPEDVVTIKSDDEFPINSMFVIKRKKTTTGTDTRGPVIMQGFVDPQKESKNQVLVSTELENETDVSWILENSKSDARYFPKDLTNIGVTEGDWYTMGVAWYMGEEFGNIAMFKNGERVGAMDLESTEEENYVPLTDMKAYVYTGTYSDVSDNTGFSSIDYAYVRKFASEEPTVTFKSSMVEETVTVEEPSKINVTPASGIITAIRIFDTEDYDEAAIAELKESGLNTVMLLTDGDNIWNLEKFVKTAHDNDMQVYAMIHNNPASESDMDNSEYVTSVVQDVVDYNSKSLSSFDGVDIALDPCSENLSAACTLNLLLIEDVREMAGNDLAIAVDIPSSYTVSDISGVSETADLVILQTYDTEGENPATKGDVIDAVASRMGEIRASEGKALIGVAVGEDFMTNSDVQTLLTDIQDYYAEDSAFLGTSIVVYEDYESYAGIVETEEPETQETESPGIPGFTGLLAVAGMLAIALRQKKESK
ncbi:MAG: DUF2341 domain-containing protein [Methanolobus sp.]